MSLNGEAAFGLSLLKEISVNQTTVISPISVALALSLVHLGAKGNTKNQIRDALCDGSEHADCTSHFAELQKGLAEKDHPYLKNWIWCSKPGNISCVPEDLRQYYQPAEVPADFPLQQTEVLMNVANRVFASNNIKVKKTYQDELASKFDATVQNLDYSKANKAAEIVNNYVKQETVGKINNIVGADSFSDGRLALLVNAVYFHGRWQNTFASYMSKWEKFYSKEGVSKEVKFMKHEDEWFPYQEIGDFVALALPYKDRNYRLTIAVPKKRFGLAEALKKLTAHELHQIATITKTSAANVQIPQFKIDAEMQLADVLQKIGVTDLFTNKADLSGITDSPAMLGKVSHKVTIDVNEKGTTAAASTAVEAVPMSGKIPSDQPVNFVADQPFLFVLSKLGHILFTGQYYG